MFLALITIQIRVSGLVHLDVAVLSYAIEKLAKPAVLLLLEPVGLRMCRVNAKR